MSKLAFLPALLLVGCTHGDPYEPATCINKTVEKPLAIDTVYVGSDTTLSLTFEFSVCVRPA